ncbi:MAG: GNAT family N-acetyltransferase [Bacteroidota bacterium]
MIGFIPYSKKYEPACLSIFRSNIPEYFDPREEQEFLYWINGPGENTYFVMFDNLAATGCGGYFVDHENKEAGLAWGMIGLSSHKKGYGRKLTLYRLEIIEEKFPGYSILCRTSNKTFEFYQKMGFSILEIKKNGWGTGLDKYTMSKL